MAERSVHRAVQDAARSCWNRSHIDDRPPVVQVT